MNNMVLEAGETAVAGQIDHETVVRGAVQNIGL